MRRMFFGEGVRNAKIAVAGIKPSDIVADVGVGTGFLAEGALAAGARVIGIDSSDGMLTQARRRFAEKRFQARAGEIDSVPLSTGCVSALDSRGRTIWIADAHRGDGKRFVVRADEKLTAFLELEAVVRAV
jgi:SAM-dependent methyltransferase